MKTTRVILGVGAFLFIVSCGGGGGGDAPAASTTPISIVSLEKSSSAPLAPLTITTSGGNTTDTVTVTYSSSAGFSATSEAVSVASGSVVIPVPLYIDPATHNTAAGDVSITLTQGGKTTDAKTLTIQDLPPLSDYGTTVGQISHALLIYEQLLSGRRLNEMQTMQTAIPSVSTSGVASTIRDKLIPGANNARFDVDLIIGNTATTFPWGTLPDGTVIQFDSTQLEFMDRIAALYLMQQFGGTVTSDISKKGINKALSTADIMQSLLTSITTGNKIDEFTEDMRNAPSSPASGALAWLDGMKAVAESSEMEKFAGYVGVTNGIAHVGNAANNMFNLILTTPACLASPGTCNDKLADEIQNEGLNIAKADMGAMSSIFGIAGTGGLAEQIGTVVSESFQAVINIYQATQDGSLQDLSNKTSALVQDASYTNVISSLGLVSGNVAVSNSLGTAASLYGVQLQGDFNITTVADSGGSYDLVIPMNVSGVSYTNTTVDVFDFITGGGLTSTTVDLSGVSTSTPVQVPPMSATCSDPDYNSQDGDDPDCD